MLSHLKVSILIHCCIQLCPCPVLLKIKVPTSPMSKPYICEYDYTYSCSNEAQILSN